KISGQRDVCVVSPVAGRGPADERVIGCYASWIVVRVRLRPDEPFDVLLASVRDELLAALSHADLPPDPPLRIARPPSAHRVTTASCGFEKDGAPIHRIGADGPRVELVEIGSAAPTFPLTVEILEYADELRGRVKYAARLFRPETVRAWTEEYRALLDRLAE